MEAGSSAYRRCGVPYWFYENLFDRLTVSQGFTQYVTTEFGLGLALVYGVVAILCWRHRREQPSVEDGARPT